MGRVSLEFLGNARSAVAAARETQESLKQTGRAADSYSAQVQVAKKETESLSRGMLAGAEVSGELRRALLLGSSAFIGGYGFVTAIKTATQAAIEHEASQKQLIAAVKAAGLNFDAERGSIEKTLKSQRDLAGFSEDDTVKAYTAAIRATQNVSEANRLASIAADLARGRNMDLVSATQLVIKVNGGQLGSVRRLLPFIDKHATAAQALATIQQRYAGSTEAFAKSAAGAQARLSNAIKETEIAIGQALLPTITKYEGELATWLSKSENQKRIQQDVNHGDPQAIADAQKALDAAQYDQQLADLQAQADAERNARDQQFQDQEQAYKDQRDQQRNALQQWLDDQAAALEAGTEQWGTFYGALTKMAADGGWQVGVAFWAAWAQAQAQFGFASGAGVGGGGGGGAEAPGS
jgi:hypothetical protein